jgi:hypothetical protein
MADTSSPSYEQSAHTQRAHYQYVLFSQFKFSREPTYTMPYETIHLYMQILYNGTDAFTKFVNIVLSHPNGMNRCPLCSLLFVQHLQKEMYPCYCNMGA